MKQTNKYDVVIIGAGIGGLVCGCLLAKEKMKVLILEKEHQAGGYCVSFKRAGVRFDAGAHIIGSCGAGGVLYRIFKMIGLENDFQRISPTDRFFFPGLKLDVPHNVKSFIAVLKKMFPGEAGSLDNFFNEMFRISKNVRLNRDRYKTITYQGFLDSYFSDAKLKAILSAQSGFLGVIPGEISAISMCSMMSSYLIGGAYYPRGGADRLASSLAMRFIKLGGDLRLMHRVTELSRKSAGEWTICAEPRIGNPEHFFSRIVVSDSDMAVLFNKLLDKGSISRIDEIRRLIAASKRTPSIFAMYIAAGIRTKDIAGKVGWHHKSYDINRDLNKCLFLSCPSIYDDTASENGIRVLEAMRLCPYSSYEVDNYDEYKKGLENSVLKELYSLVPNLKNSIIMHESATPGTMRRYTLNNSGSAYGWALHPEQYDRNEMISAMCEPNLYLTGHWTNPGGGIMAVAVSGFNAARKIMALHIRQ